MVEYMFPMHETLSLIPKERKKEEGRVRDRRGDLRGRRVGTCITQYYPGENVYLASRVYLHSLAGDTTVSSIQATP